MISVQTSNSPLIRRLSVSSQINFLQVFLTIDQVEGWIPYRFFLWGRDCRDDFRLYARI